MLNKKSLFLFGFFVVGLSGLLVRTCYPSSSLLYKNYIIRKDRGNEILCEPYIVQKSDWVLKLFRQKGEIAYKNFPEFLRIFKRINQNIDDINIIRPGQRIAIPLKKIRPGSLPGQASGLVTIPFVTISNMSRILKANSFEYKVQAGDCVSKIISTQFSRYGKISYNEGIKLFKFINPDIVNLNRIYAGQIINVPVPSIRKEPSYKSLIANYENFTSKAEKTDSLNIDGVKSKPGAHQEMKNSRWAPFLEAASILEAKLIYKGFYYFPKPGKKDQAGNDFELNLSRFPIMKLRDGTRVLFSQPESNIKENEKTIKAYWNKVGFASLPLIESVENIIDSVLETTGNEVLEKKLLFKDGKIEVNIKARWIINDPSSCDKPECYVCISLIDSITESTSNTILAYLARHGIIVKDIILENNKVVRHQLQKTQTNNPADDDIAIFAQEPEAFVNELLKALGYLYTQNINISFPYAGIQIEAISNIISRKNSNPLLVDFGDFYGDAIHAIKKAGLDIVQIDKKDDTKAIIRKILKATCASFTSNPVFTLAKRPVTNNILLTIPGFLIENEVKDKIFLAIVHLPKEIRHYLKEQEIKLIVIDAKGNF